MTSRLRTIPFRRKREGRTDYRKRRELLKAGAPRVVIRPALRNITAQLIEYRPEGDRVLAGVHSHALDERGYPVHKGNLPAAYLTGYLLGKKAVAKGITRAILDTGPRTPIRGSRIYACVKGLLDAGVGVPVAEDQLPSGDRIRGEHIAAGAAPHARFTEYQQKKIDPRTLAQLVAKIKKNIEEAP